MKNFVIIITGPTAVGKSDFALTIAEKIGGEIINADIGSFYKPLSIGTAKPDVSKTDVPHHLIDFISDPEDFSIVLYRKKLIELCQDIWQRGKTPIIVGGSVFYIQSFFYKQHEVADLKYFQDELEKDVIDTKDLWQRLWEIDSERSLSISPSDRYRIIRALALFKATGKQPKDLRPIFDPIASSYVIICNRQREDLYQRINQRVLDMLHNGWREEVSALKGTPWESFLMKKKMMGYDVLLKADNDLKEEVVCCIQQSTRHYAKRQITFLKKLKKDLLGVSKKDDCFNKIDEIDLTLIDVGLYIRQLLSEILHL